MKWTLMTAILSQAMILVAADGLSLSEFRPTDTSGIYAGELTNNSAKEVHFDSNDSFRFELQTDEGWKPWIHHPSVSPPTWIRVPPNTKKGLIVRIPEEVFSQGLPARVVLIVAESANTKKTQRVASPSLAEP